MFSQFAEEDKNIECSFSIRCDAHVFVCSCMFVWTRFLDLRLTRVRTAYRAWLFILLHADIYIYIFIWRDQRWGEETRSVDTAGFLNDK